ncbi:MAG: hypothetical protein GY769_17320 [bacterium]|nr:hypothetical protein [bacterium]
MSSLLEAEHSVRLAPRLRFLFGMLSAVREICTLTGITRVGSGSSKAVAIALIWILRLQVPVAAEAEPAGLESVDVAPVWSGHPVHFALETAGRWQYVAFYDPQRRMTVAQRSLDSADWSFQRLPSVVGWDSHNYLAMAVDLAGFIHVSGNMHGDRLVYFRSTAAHDISSFETPGMVGELEKRVSYPRFIHGAEDELYFQYRDGKSGNGTQILNAYDVDSRRWRRHLSEPLLDGEESESAYSVGPVKGPDGYFHLVWLWRESPDGATNHDLSYARSRDLIHWETASGKRLDLPIRPGVEEALVDPVRSGGGLAGVAFGVGWDARHRPIVTYSKYDAAGKSQAYNSRWAGNGWEVARASDWTYRWDLARTGTLQEATVVRPPTIDEHGNLTQEFRHVEQGAGIWVLDEDTLTPVVTLPIPDGLRLLNEPESPVPGMEVREFIHDRRGEYFLRWETLPVNRDRPRDPPHPEPSRLRVYRKAQEGEAGTAESASSDHVVPPKGFLEASNVRIGAISVEVGNVFDESDPTENRKLFRMVNRYRRKTAENVIRKELLFKSGDPYSHRLLEESERLLRSKGYLYEAEIRPTAYRRKSEEIGGEVDVVVRTRDVWTLTGGASYSRSGGENSTRFHIEDTNFLGTGKELGVSRESDVERTRNEFQFRDFNLFGTRAEAEVLLEENSDGYRRFLKLKRPFFALDSRRSKGITLLTEERIDPLFERGEVATEFRHEIDQLTAFWGFSRGLHDGVARRLSLGFTFLRDRFTQLADRPPPTDLPPDRTISYPWIGFDWVEDRFIEAADLDKIARIEDVNLGTVISARAGWSSPAFGGDRDEALVGFDASSGFHLGPGRLLFIDSTGGTRWSKEGFANAALSGTVRFYRRNLGRHIFYAEFQAAAVENLDAEQQLLIGGDSGLRGYPLRFQSGDRRLLLTLEQRYYSKREVFKLATLGAAVFLDIGTAWFAGSDSEDDLGVLRDVGFGLRMSPTRSSGKTVVHLDVAFPLDAGGSIESIQYLVTTKETL